MSTMPVNKRPDLKPKLHTSQFSKMQTYRLLHNPKPKFQNQNKKTQKH